MTYCGINCCANCGRFGDCGGCEACKGHPCGGSCIAERNEDFHILKDRLIDEINALKIPGLAVDDLHMLIGEYVNLQYPLANGSTARFLNDKDVYLGNQIERADSKRCYGVVANECFMLICEYGRDGSDPEILMYRKR